MSTTKLCEFEISPRENRFGEPVGMKIRLELDDDAGLIVTGTSVGDSGGQAYMGTLTLRRAGRAALEGGDECWVNGVWVSPCPPSSEGGDDDEEPPDGGTGQEADK